MSEERFVAWDETVPADPPSVANGLRAIADRVERDGLCLLSIYSTGFGEPWEAALQVIATVLPDQEGGQQ